MSNNKSLRKKVLLMGRSGSGKTSMRSIIFANYLAKETGRLGPTLDVEHSHVKFLGNLRLNLWDCGGQNAFMDTYLESQREKIFRDVAVLIYVFDIKSDTEKKDLADFDECLEAISQNSQHAKVFCLLHKMDLIPKEERDHVYAEKCEALQTIAHNIKLQCYATSIWDETLYKCWSEITYSLIPNIQVIEKNLDNFCRITGADEVVLFERSTFLVIAHSEYKSHTDVHRFEKISNIIKQFKLSCAKGISQFQSMQVKNKHFKAFIEGFTPNTHIMVIVSDSEIQEATIKVNINVARKHFEKIWSSNDSAVL